MKIIPATLTRKVARQVLIAKKNSPHIFFGLGVAGVLGSTVLACRSTLRLAGTLDDIKFEVEETKRIRNNPTIFADTNGEQQYYRDLGYVYAKGIYRMGKLYAPSIVVGTLSIASLTGSHVTLARRNSALTAAYAGISLAYEEYRARVREELGIEKELDLYYGVQIEKVKGEDGKVHELKVVDPNKLSPYAKFFDEYSPSWQKNAELNRMFVQCQQNWANHRLQAVGHVFLNEVYDSLGIPRTSAGAIVGWVISDDGDNYIDFGLFEAANKDFVNGLERSILLDFNVDGVIVSKIDKINKRS